MQIADEILEVVELKAIPPSRLYVRFSDNEEKEIDLSRLIETPPPVFAPLQGPEEFAKVRINIIGGISWHCGADLSADYLKKI